MNPILSALLLGAVLLPLTACDPIETTSAIQPSATQSGDASRISVQMLKPGGAPAEQWQASVVASYRPLEQGAEGTTVTTTSRDNCPRSTGVVFVPLPSFGKCTRTFDRTVDLDLPARQISWADAQTINLDVQPVIEDGGAQYRVDALHLQLKPCEGDCEELSLTLDLSCYAGERTDEIISQSLRLSYSNGSQVHADATACGLKKGDWYGWAGRDAIMARIRGHFGEAEGGISNDLLDTFTAFPTQDNRWIWNPTANLGSFSDFCPAGDGGYANTDYQGQLSAEQGWPYGPDAEVRVFSKNNGEVCAIWLENNHPHPEGYVTRVRYFVEFANGQLVQLHTEEPDNLQRTWRYVDGQAMEYISRQDPDSVAGEDNVNYWHRLAAEAWPARMDYTPDLQEFAAQQAFAKVLLERFPPAPAPE
ncbi:hypothetical protein ACX0MV_02635 [Pseudomonas borbori]